MSVALASCYAAADARYRIAPADEYFGRMKMSILEIGNRLRATSARAEQQSGPDAVLHDAQMTEDAIHDWEHKYPRDPWLAKDVARLVHIYAHVETGASRRRMHACMAWLERRYAGRRELIAVERVEVAIADAQINSAVARDGVK